jgi:rod shape-determining protein MreB
VTHVERRALLTAAEHARIGRVMMMDEGLAAAFGAGVKLEEARASAVVDIGSGTTNVAIVGNGAIIHSRSDRIGSADINTAIINHVRRHRGLAIGPPSAERLKLELASATLPEDLGREIIVRGRDVVTGSPGAIKITAGEIYPVAQYVVGKIADGVSTTLAELSPEVAGDIYDRGIILTGGGALFNGIDDYMREQTNLTVRVADEPRHSIVRGLAQMFDDPLLLRRVVRSDAPPLLNDESEAYSI